MQARLVGLLVLLLLGFTLVAAGPSVTAHEDPDNDANCEGTACSDVEWDVQDCKPTCQYDAAGHHWLDPFDSGPSTVKEGSGWLTLGGEDRDEEPDCRFRPVLGSRACHTSTSFTGPRTCQTVEAHTEIEYVARPTQIATVTEDVFC